MLYHNLAWDYPEPHVIEHVATADEADGYGHINNSVYLHSIYSFSSIPYMLWHYSL